MEKELTPETSQASIISKTDSDLNWPERKTLNVRLLFDTNKIAHDIQNIRRIIDAFDQFKHGLITENQNAKDKEGTKTIWKGIKLHSQELNRALKDDKFGDHKVGNKNTKYDSDETFYSDTSIHSGTSSSVLLHASKYKEWMQQDAESL